jgi:arginine exporter protein ArgO
VAAGLLPSLMICGVCVVLMTLLGSALVGSAALRPENVWGLLGLVVGMVLSFLMLRSMYRGAKGWEPVATVPVERSGMATAALVLTILGGALLLVVLIGRWRADFVPLSLGVHVAGLICGVLSRSEPTGRWCAWLSGGMFVLLLLLTA